jgi:hypothetical protein
MKFWSPSSAGAKSNLQVLWSDYQSVNNSQLNGEAWSAVIDDQFTRLRPRLLKLFAFLIAKVLAGNRKENHRVIIPVSSSRRRSIKGLCVYLGT